ncbi:hypothetical protein C8J56DRAFT_1063008 [Mycena floridula]|nr:hypothetical protein C8J56DRAFT_1063008 [Mycena floridula]
MVESDTLRTAVVFKSIKWNAGEKITIKFLNGEYEPSGFREKVKKYAAEWIVPGLTANLKFDWVQDGDAEVRIAYDNKSRKNWSCLGTQCYEVKDQSEPTVKFYWPPGETEKDHARHVRHEFGHVLGFVHEHQHPQASIPWDLNALYAYYSQGDRDKAWVNANVAGVYNVEDVDFLSYDKTSVMHYEIKEEWVTDKSYKVDPPSLVLSRKDKELAYKSYPPS